MGVRSFHLRPLGSTIAASLAWPTANFTLAQSVALRGPFKFAGTGLRLATRELTTDPVNNYVINDMAIGMPTIDVTEIWFFFPTFYCDTTGEFDCPNGYTVEGIATRVPGGLRTRGLVNGGNDPVVIDPSQAATQYGAWIRFTPAAPIPANTVQLFSFSFFIPVGTYPFSRPNVTIPTLVNIFGDLMPDERHQCFSTSTVSMLSGSADLNNSGGPRGPQPAAALMRGDGVSVPLSAFVLGDSIQYGSAQTRNAAFYTSRMTFGMIDMALDDDVESRRIAYNSFAVPGWSYGANSTGQQHGNTTDSMRQLWALERAREINDGRPLADMIWTGHGQNSSTSGDLPQLLTDARTTAALWRSAIGNEDAPLHWIGMSANTDTTDGQQTVENQTPRNTQAIWPTGNRWLFNAAHELSDGALRVDGTVQSGTAIWPVSSANADPDRDLYEPRAFNTVLTSAYSGTGPMFMAEAPTPGEWLGFIDGGDFVNGAPVTAVTGTGPYEVTINIPGSPAISNGAIVQGQWTDGGVHPSPIAHVEYSAPIIAQKVALGYTPIAVPDVAPEVTAASISGIPQDGQVLTASITVTGTPTPTVTYQWQRNGTNISGQTSATITLDASGMSLVDDDVISCEITATNAAGSDTAEPTILFEVPAPSVLVQGSPAGYFVDPLAVPSGTTRITFRGSFLFPASGWTTCRPFTQESTGCDLIVNVAGSAAVTIEDGTGAAMLSSANIAPVGTIPTDEWVELVFDVDQVAETATLTVDGTDYDLPFIGSSNGVFQTVREVSLLAQTSGANAVPAGTRIADLSVDFNGTLHKAISNSAAVANADPWHTGGDFTDEPAP